MQELLQANCQKPCNIHTGSLPSGNAVTCSAKTTAAPDPLQAAALAAINRSPAAPQLRGRRLFDIS